MGLCGRFESVFSIVPFRSNSPLFTDDNTFPNELRLQAEAHFKSRTPALEYEFVDYPGKLRLSPPDPSTLTVSQALSMGLLVDPQGSKHCQLKDMKRLWSRPSSGSKAPCDSLLLTGN